MPWHQLGDLLSSRESTRIPKSHNEKSEIQYEYIFISRVQFTSPLCLLSKVVPRRIMSVYMLGSESNMYLRNFVRL